MVGYDELFFSLNNTDWGVESGFDRNKLFLGAGWMLGKDGRWTEIGYLNQFVNNTLGRNLMQHILSVNLFLIF